MDWHPRGEAMQTCKRNLPKGTAARLYWLSNANMFTVILCDDWIKVKSVFHVLSCHAFANNFWFVCLSLNSPYLTYSGVPLNKICQLFHWCLTYFDKRPSHLLLKLLNLVSSHCNGIICDYLNQTREFKIICTANLTRYFTFYINIASTLFLIHNEWDFNYVQVFIRKLFLLKELKYFVSRHLSNYIFPLN